MTKPRLLLLAASSSLLFALGLPNEYFHYGFPLLGFLALVPLYLAIGSTPSFGLAALLTGLYGALHHALSSYWLFFFKDFALWTIGGSSLAYFFVYALLGLYLALLLKRSGPYRPLAFAFLWTSFELLKSTGFLGYPWGLLPYTQTELLPLLQIADRTGVYGLSFILAFSNAALAEFLLRGAAGSPGLGGAFYRTRLEPPYPKTDKRPASAGGPPPGQGKRGRIGAPAGGRLWLRLPPLLPLEAPQRAFYLMVALLLLGFDLGYGLYRLSRPFAERPGFEALVVQQNIDPWYAGEEEALAATIGLARRGLAAAAKKPELLLFSESSLRRPYREYQPWFERRPAADPLLPFIRETGSYLFTGAPVVLDWEDFQASNSVILIDPSGKLVADYAKIHPVPFAEAIPFWEFEGFRRFMQEKVGLESGWVMGSEYTLFELPTKTGKIAFGAPICFEDAFAGLCREFALRGARLLVNLTNDAWSRTASAEVQHFAAARFRSIELRIPLLRSTNGGVSGLVGPYGEFRELLPLFEGTSRLISLPLVDAPPTVYLRFGDWFAYSCLLLSAVWSLILIEKEMRGRRKRP